MDLYKLARDFPKFLHGNGTLFRSGQIVRSGMSATSMLWHARKDRLVRAHHGTYLVPGREPLDLLDRVRAALSVCPRGTVVGFHTAAALLGFGVPEDDDVHIVVPSGGPFPQRPGIAVHQATLPVGAPLCPFGIPCTRPARTVIDLARSLDRVTALAVLDAALYARKCTRAEIEREVRLHSGLRGVTQARELVALADGRAECKQETHLRLILHDEDILGFEPQVKIYDPEKPGKARYRLDLANRALQVAVEYDGDSHTRASLRGDRARHNWLDGLGWRMRYFTDVDLYLRAETIAPAVKKAMRRSRAND